MNDFITVEEDKNCSPLLKISFDIFKENKRKKKEFIMKFFLLLPEFFIETTLFTKLKKKSKINHFR